MNVATSTLRSPVLGPRKALISSSETDDTAGVSVGAEADAAATAGVSFGAGGATFAAGGFAPAQATIDDDNRAKAKARVVRRMSYNVCQIWFRASARGFKQAFAM